MNEFEYNEGKCYDFLMELQDLLGNVSTFSIREIRELNVSDYNEFPQVAEKLGKLKSDTSLPRDWCENMISIIHNSISYVVDYEKALIGDVERDLPDSVEISYGDTTVSNYNGDTTVYSYNSSSLSSANNISSINILNSDYSKTKKDNNSIDEQDIESLLLKILTPFGIKKSNFSGVTKSEKYDYIVTINNINENGKWNPNDIKEYYIKDNKVVGILTGNNCFVSVEDGKLVFDKSKVSSYSSIFISSTGVVSDIFANKTNYNNENNREIFKKFYNDVTDEEFNNFCDTISETGDDYIKISQNIINSYSDKMNDLFEKMGYDSLVIEDNVIKIDSKSIATELFAYESSKLNVNYSEGIQSEIIFNAGVMNDIAEYLSTNYGIDLSVKDILIG